MHGRWSRLALKMPSTVIVTPASVNRPETQASHTMPVMMVADASTMAIWKAADASSKWWYFSVATLRSSSACLARSANSSLPSWVDGSER